MTHDKNRITMLTRNEPGTFQYMTIGAPGVDTETSGIVWVTNMSSDWLMVAFGNHQPVVTTLVTQTIPESLALKAGAQSP